MRRLLAALVAFVVLGFADVHAQQPTRSDSVEIRYYDRWPGVWHRIDGDAVDSLPTFEVRRGPGNSFLEHWFPVIDGKRTPSFGLRSWTRTQRPGD